MIGGSNHNIGIRVLLMDAKVCIVNAWSRISSQGFKQNIIHRKVGQLLYNQLFVFQVANYKDLLCRHQLDKPVIGLL